MKKCKEISESQDKETIQYIREMEAYIYKDTQIRLASDLSEN